MAFSSPSANSLCAYIIDGDWRKETLSNTVKIGVLDRSESLSGAAHKVNLVSLPLYSGSSGVASLPKEVISVRAKTATPHRGCDVPTHLGERLSWQSLNVFIYPERHRTKAHDWQNLEGRRF